MERDLYSAKDEICVRGLCVRYKTNRCDAEICDTKWARISL